MLRHWTAGVVCAALLFSLSPAPARAVDPAVVAAQKHRAEIVDKIAPSVVAIFAAGGRGGGSGVLISADGYALTNFHVTRGAGTFMKCGLSDGKIYDAVVVGLDPTGDVALVKLLGRTDFPHATLGDSDTLKAGDWTYALGNPFLLATDFRPTVTYGIVSGVHRYQYPAGNDLLEYTDCIQIDTSINPGNSGGPLFSDDGKLMGINGRGSFEKRGRVNSGAGYAISINQIKNFMGHLRSGRIVDHATLGATVETARNGDVVVQNILVESEAFRRGLEIGDVIENFAGRPIRSVNQYKNILGIYPKGWKLPLTYRRDNKRTTVYVRLRALHQSTAFVPAKKQPPKIPRKKRPRGKPIPIPGKKRSGGPPAKYKHLYVKKDGFANYYFNKLEQDRTLRAMKSLGDFSHNAGRWTLKGKTGTGAPFTITLDDKAAGFEIRNTLSGMLLDQPFLDVPKGTGGLMAALNNLRLFFTHGREGTAFPDFYYLGTEPLDGKGDMVDVLVTDFTNAVNDKIHSVWYFHPRDGRLLGFDTYLEKDVDPCQVRFESFKDFGGRKLPDRMVVSHADRTWNTLVVESADLAAGTIKSFKKKQKSKKTGKTE